MAFFSKWITAINYAYWYHQQKSTINCPVSHIPVDHRFITFLLRLAIRFLRIIRKWMQKIKLYESLYQFLGTCIGIYFTILRELKFYQYQCNGSKFRWIREMWSIHLILSKAYESRGISIISSKSRQTLMFSTKIIVPFRYGTRLKDWDK